MRNRSQPGPVTVHAVAGVFFNRGVVAWRAYQERFGPVAPNKVANHEAYRWLSRGLEGALIAFIGQAVDAHYTLRGAFYEFEYAPVVTRCGLPPTPALTSS